MTTSDGTVGAATKIVDHGIDAARYVITILSEGYQQAELPTFATDALNFANSLAATPPFPGLWSGVNVYRVDVSSTDSGASDTGNCGQPQVTMHTYFDALFCPSGSGAASHRLLQVNYTTAHNVAETSVPGTDLIFVIVNSSSYGGSGQSGIAVLSKDPASLDIGLHEMGHSAFGLADEYADPAPTQGGDSYSGTEPIEPNVTTVTDSNAIKWKALLSPGVAMPTTKNGNCAVVDPQTSPVPAGTVGAFDGARYFHCGIYRPEYDCKMRTVAAPPATPVPFCHVCSDTITAALQPYLLPAGPAPVITSISPTAGDPAGGTIVVIRGSGFTAGASVNFGVNPSVTSNVDSDTQITAVTPAGLGSVTVWVATATGATSSTAGASFTYSTPSPAPQITIIAPATGPTTGGTSVVVVSGAGFTGTVAVSFGATPAASFNVDTDTQITATSPASAVGTVDISVTGPTGTSSASTPDQFTFAAPTPTVTGVSPTNGSVSGGTTVTVSGTGFTGATSVAFGAAGANFTIVSDSQLTTTSPAGSGVVDVFVTTPSGTSAAASADQFTYSAGGPQVTGGNPNSGSGAGGDTVTISGSGFSGATAVSFGVNAAPMLTVDSDTQITTSSPADFLSAILAATRLRPCFGTVS
ncbi:IPT/TIG domain-containing protein [Paraburkholderia nodosa]|uniref:IPT/TIG domain-containing protein n=1 Tax=Paraburkholderia nodosa TaxID=392320 RepID=UPI0004AF214C|nr:M64 family metallopeptidase [Paraburkholderia nodosa]